MPFGVCRSRRSSVVNLLHSEIIVSLVWNFFSGHNCTHSAWIKLSWSSDHPSGTLAVALIILLLVGALVGTLDIRLVLGALIISNCWVCSRSSLRACFPLLLQVCLSLTCLGIYISSTNLQLQISAGKCAPRCFLPALLVWWLPAVEVVFDSGTVIPLLYIVAPPRTNPWQLCISELPRLSWNFIRVCNLGMWLLDSFVSEFAITSLRALFATRLLFWWMRFTVLHSCIACTVIAHSKGCCDSSTVIPLLEIIALLTTYLIQHRDVEYLHCSCDSGSDSGSYSALEFGLVAA